MAVPVLTLYPPSVLFPGAFDRSTPLPSQPHSHDVATGGDDVPLFPLSETRRGPYSLAHLMEGASFLDGFDFFTARDPTRGAVRYLSRSEALAKGLVYTSDTHTYLAAESSSVLEVGEDRPSVRLESKRKWRGGLMVLDLMHMPVGCGVWPAWWTFGEDWPRGGEFDVVETVNSQTDVPTEQWTRVHTGAGCVMEEGDASTYTGRLTSRNCDIDAPGQDAKEGCSIRSQTALVGSELNNAGGGVYAVEWSPAEFLRVWFFRHGSEPHDLLAHTPRPERWGLPHARYNFRARSCDPTSFQPQKVVFTTTLCGEWAGHRFKQHCPHLAHLTCEEHVAKHPEAFKEAFWIVRRLLFYERGLTEDDRSAPP